MEGEKDASERLREHHRHVAILNEPRTGDEEQEESDPRRAEYLEEGDDRDQEEQLDTYEDPEGEMQEVRQTAIGTCTY